MESVEEFFVIFTKYGFVYEVFRSEEDESENYLLENVTFSKSPKSAMRIARKESPAPPFARTLTKKPHINIDGWVQEIGGFLIKCREKKLSEHSFGTGFYSRKDNSLFEVLDNYHFNNRTKFESLEEDLEEDGCC